MNLFALIIGSPFLVGGLWGGLRCARTRALIGGTPRSRIADAAGGGLVHIRGKVVAGEQVLIAPFGGGQAVWAQVSLEEGSGRSSSSLVNETQCRPFYIDDGSGQLARILPDGADVDVGDVQSGSFSDPSRLAGLTDFVGFERAVHFPATNYLGIGCNFGYWERVLAPGDDVFAVGPSRREPAPPDDDPNRQAQASELVLQAEPGPRGRLLLSTKLEAKQVASLGWRIAISIVAIAVGLFLVSGGVLSR